MLLQDLLLRPFLQYLILLLLVIGSYLPYVVGVGVFEVKLREMHNPGGRAADQSCCAGPEPSSKCANPCSTRVVSCLRQYSPAHPADCTYGYNISRVLGNNSFVFSNGYLVKFPISSNWPGSFSLKVVAQVSGSEQTIVEALLQRKSFDANIRWSNSTYTLPTAGGSKISISFSYRFVCAKNNYGADCAKTCIPRNDHFGHYRCDADGNIVCLDGWGSGPTDKFCEKPICNPSCKNGRCIRPNTCSCTMGWQGSSCDQCVVYPGCVHGTCNDKYECNCDKGWGGQNCDLELDYCGKYKPCKHGDCKNTIPGRYNCHCYKGYRGLNCESEVNECASNPCMNGGNCTDKLASFSCACPSGFTGTRCDVNINDCPPSACANGGVCIDGVNSYECRCPAGFTGRVCEVMLPTETPLTTTEQFNTSVLVTTPLRHMNNSVVGEQRKSDAASWSTVINIVIPVVICVLIFLFVIIGIITWKFYRHRCCICGYVAAASNRDPEEPNTLSDVKRVDSRKEMDDDLKRCHVGTSNVRNNTPDIIINFVPSRPSHKNINTEKASRTRKGKDADLSPLEKSRQCLELTDIIPEQDLGEYFLPNRCFDKGYWQDIEVEI